MKDLMFRCIEVFMLVLASLCAVGTFAVGVIVIAAVFTARGWL
jgi:hypothetical protein